MARVFLGLPNRGEVCNGVLTAVTSASHHHQVMASCCETGNLDHCFNHLFCDAFNDRERMGISHFCLHHADIRAEVGFLDIMVAEMDRVDADILSVVVPIGDERGLTSTGIQTAHEQRWHARRLSMSEIHDLPETFSIAETPWPDWWLAVNTGLMLVRFDCPWVDDFPGFETKTRLLRDGANRYPLCWPEDWGMSYWANEQGLRVFATRKVKVTHRKVKEYANDISWGEWAVDHECQELHHEKGVDHADERMAGSGSHSGDRRDGDRLIHAD